MIKLLEKLMFYFLLPVFLFLGFLIILLQLIELVEALKI